MLKDAIKNSGTFLERYYEEVTTVQYVGMFLKD